MHFQIVTELALPVVGVTAAVNALLGSVDWALVMKVPQFWFGE